MKKKTIKRIMLGASCVLFALYLLGSCSSRVPVREIEASTPTQSFIEVDVDEYEKRLQDAILDRTSFFSSYNTFLTANAFNPNDVLNDFFEKTNVYKVNDWLSGYLDYLRNPDYYPDDNVNVPPPVNSSNSENPVTSTLIPYHYNAYGKMRLVYNGGVSELVVCRFDADLSTSTQIGKGHVFITRNSSDGYSTSFGFDVNLTGVIRNFNSTNAFIFSYRPLDSNVTGIDTTSITWKNLVVSTSTRSICFSSELTNSIRTSDIKINTPASYDSFIISSTGSPYNSYTVSQTLSNHYEFNVGLSNYQSNNSRTKSVNVYYNNNAQSTVTTNNYNQYSDYGYTYNNITGSLEFNPDVLANYFNNSIKPALELGFDDLFSAFPDIDATLKDYTGELNNIVELIEQNNTSTQTTATTPSLPVVTGDINVSVDVTFPDEFYKQYPALTTSPAYKVLQPDFDFAFDSEIPENVLRTGGSLLNLSDSIITDAGLKPIALFSVAVGLIGILI